MKRRKFLGQFLATAAATLAMPAIGRGQSQQVLTVVPQADLGVLDPIWTTAYQTRDHGAMVFDTLFGTDTRFRAQPQMVEGVVTEDDGKRWRLTLRPGLKFHDGTPVLARDCVASITRWGARDSFGQALMAATDAVSAADDKTIEFRLKRRFPLLPDALGKSPPSICAIMPERLAATDPNSQVTEMVGSGPYRYKPDERVPGSRVVYERFADYVPRPEGTADASAGPKRAHFERVEWRIIPEGGTVAAALQRGEVDWWLIPDVDLLPLLKRDKKLTVRITDSTGFIGTMRFNHLIPPFDNVAMRRAVVAAVQQSDYMTAIAGTDSSLWKDRCGVFCPGTPMASAASVAALGSARDPAALKHAFEEAGYHGERIVLLAPTNIAGAKALADITYGWMKTIGLNVDYQGMDWATLVQRRAKQDPVERGGWNLYHTSWSGADHLNPVGHVFLRGNGAQATVGWPTSREIETLREAWLQASDVASQQVIAARLQEQAFQDVPYVPLGQYFLPAVYQANLTGVLDGNPVFWSVRRS